MPKANRHERMLDQFDGEEDRASARQSIRDDSRKPPRELSVPLGMSRMYLAHPIDRRTADALFREIPEDEEEDEDEIRDDEEEDDEGEEGDDEEDGDGYSEC